MPNPSAAPAENVDPLLYFAEGDPEPEAKLPGEAWFDFFALAADGTVSTETATTICGAARPRPRCRSRSGWANGPNWR